MTTKKLEELQEKHSEMLATAHDLGVSVPDELKTAFTDAEAGASICNNLDALIREHQKKPVAADDPQVQNTEVKPAKRAPPKRPSTKKVAAAPKEKEAMATKTTKSKARTAVKGKTSARKGAYAGDATITWNGEDNPARKGTGRWQRIELVRKHGGKTMDKYRKAGGKDGSVRWCVGRRLAKVG